MLPLVINKVGLKKIFLNCSTNVFCFVFVELNIDRSFFFGKSRIVKQENLSKERVLCACAGDYML